MGSIAQHDSIHLLMLVTSKDCPIAAVTFKVPMLHGGRYWRRMLAFGGLLFLGKSLRGINPEKGGLYLPVI